MSNERFDSEAYKPDSFELLADLQRKLEENKVSLGGETKYARFLDEYVSDVAQAFPRLTEPDGLPTTLPELIREYTGPHNAARLQLKPNQRPYYDIDDRKLLHNESTMVICYLPEHKKFSRGLVFISDHLNGIEIVPFGSLEEAEDLRNFIQDFDHNQRLMAKMAAELSFEAAFVAATEELGEDIAKN